MRRFSLARVTSILTRPQSRRTFLRAISGAGAAAVVSGERTVGAKGRAKVAMCHATGNGSYRIISVASSAVPAHIAHGDFEAYECNGELTCFTSLPLFCKSAEVCPTEATGFCPDGPLDPTSSTQAKAACEACFGAGACVHSDLDCSGAGWLKEFAPLSEPPTGAMFGYEGGICDPDNPQPAGRVFVATASDPTTDFGMWGTSMCP